MTFHRSRRNHRDATENVSTWSTSRRKRRPVIRPPTYYIDSVCGGSWHSYNPFINTCTYASRISLNHDVFGTLKTKQFNILCQQVVYTPKLKSRIMPPDSVYFTTIREPFAWMKSAFAFFPFVRPSYPHWPQQVGKLSGGHPANGARNQVSRQLQGDTNELFPARLQPLA